MTRSRAARSSSPDSPEYRQQHPDVEIHLVGHSAGSIFLRGIIDQLAAARLPVASLTYLAAAIRTDEWLDAVLPRLRDGEISRFTSFGMSPTRELDDVCGAGGVAIYRKSLLYLVSRAFERPTDPGDNEVPLVGMAHLADHPVDGSSLTAGGRSRFPTRGSCGPPASTHPMPAPTPRHTEASTTTTPP